MTTLHSNHFFPILIVGKSGGSNIGQSFLGAAHSLGMDALLLKDKEAWSKNRVLNKVFRIFFDKKGPNTKEFSRNILNIVQEKKIKLVFVTGDACVLKNTINELKKRKIICVYFSTDDPWNLSNSSKWLLESLKNYDLILTPRKESVSDFLELGCKTVNWVRFGYDQNLIQKALSLEKIQNSFPVLFVGGCDKDRSKFFGDFFAAGGRTNFAGGYWDNHKKFKDFSLGLLEISDVLGLSRSAKINLCLVRRANRDGHVMRTFELAALGCCMLVEDTADHRDIFGADGENVMFFSSPEIAAAKTEYLLNNPNEIVRLSRAVRRHILIGGNSYEDRLTQILKLLEHCSTNPI